MPQSAEGKSEVSVQKIHQPLCYEGLNVCFSLKKKPLCFFTPCESKSERALYVALWWRAHSAAMVPLSWPPLWRCPQLLCCLISPPCQWSNFTPSCFFLIFLVHFPDVSFSHSFCFSFSSVVCIPLPAIPHLTPGTVAILNPSSSAVTVMLPSSDSTTEPAQSQLTESSKQCQIPTLPRRTARS